MQVQFAYSYFVKHDIYIYTYIHTYIYLAVVTCIRMWWWVEFKSNKYASYAHGKNLHLLLGPILLFLICLKVIRLILRQNQNILDNNDWISKHLMPLIFLCVWIFGCVFIWQLIHKTIGFHFIFIFISQTLQMPLSWLDFSFGLSTESSHLS